MTEIQMPSATQSCTNVAPVRVPRANSENHFNTNPDASITTIAEPRNAAFSF